MLNSEQIDFYNLNGYLSVDNVYNDSQIKSLSDVTNEFVEKSRLVTKENGCLMVMPGSHKWTATSHHEDGFFVGAVDIDSINIQKTKYIISKTGGISIHHVRTLHGSAPNMSNKPRRLLLFEFRVADAFSLNGLGMSWDEWNKLITRGEPTIHPKLGEMLEYCSGKFIEFKMNTNATLLNEKLIHQILKSGVTDLVFSVDSYYKEEFESLRVNANFEKVVENIKKFKQIRDEFYPNSNCVTRASGVQVSEKQDAKKFEKFWKEYVDFVVMVRMIHRWDLYNNTKDMAAITPCHYLGRNLSIYFDGSTNPCDIDYEGKLVIGSTKNSTIRDLWNGEKYKQIFDAHKNNARQNFFPCDRCPVGT